MIAIEINYYKKHNCSLQSRSGRRMLAQSGAVQPGAAAAVGVHRRAQSEGPSGRHRAARNFGGGGCDDTYSGSVSGGAVAAANDVGVGAGAAAAKSTLAVMAVGASNQKLTVAAEPCVAAAGGKKAAAAAVNGATGGGRKPRRVRELFRVVTSIDKFS